MDKESGQEFQEPFCKVGAAESESYFAGIYSIYCFQRILWLFDFLNDGYDDAFAAADAVAVAVAVAVVIDEGCRSESRFSTKSACDHMK